MKTTSIVAQLLCSTLLTNSFVQAQAVQAQEIAQVQEVGLKHLAQPFGVKSGLRLARRIYSKNRFPPKTVYRLVDLARQATAYQRVTAIFTRAERCKSMQFWGVSDKQSWLGAERKPLLFDKFFRKKPAYHAVSDALFFRGTLSDKNLSISSKSPDCATKTWQIRVNRYFDRRRKSS